MNAAARWRGDGGEGARKARPPSTAAAKRRFARRPYAEIARARLAATG